MSASRVLLVDDDAEMRAMLALTLRKGGYDVDAAEGGQAALALLAAESYDAVLTDVRMPGMDGIELLRRARAMGVEAPVIVMSAYGSLDLALDAMKAGAYDYVSKPFKRDEVLLALRKAEERERLRREVRNLRALAGRTYSEGAPVFAGERMRAVLETAERVAAYKTTVLLRGESGVGKEVLARFIHLRSPRADGPFVAVNCGAIPESLIESELFGHARGAFTDAARAKPGLFEEAGGGTLFLDEVAELPRSAQAALLRALQESEVRRVGELRPREVDVRILAATARDLEAEIAAGGFREDLFYRLNVVPLRIPALRERPEDVPALAERFIAKACGERGIAPKRVAPAAMEALRAYAWPGNVRELENVLERAVVLGDGEAIEVADLPAEVRGGLAGKGTGELSLKAAGARLEAEFIREALARTGGNRTRAARLLEISYRTLLTKIAEYGIDAPPARAANDR